MAFLESALVRFSSVDSESKELVVTYSGFARARRECSNRPELAGFLTAVVFLKLCPAGKESVPLAYFMKYLVSRFQAERVDIQLKLYDIVGHGYLRECDLESLVNDLVPTLSGLSSLKEDFVQFYVYTAVRRIMFFHDPRRTGKVQIRDLSDSDEMQQLLALREGVQPTTNWFSAEATINVYLRYIEMDSDGNGMLSKAELLKYPCGWLTPVAVDRIFQEHQTYENEMDYKGFLDLVLALENNRSEASLKYFWKIIYVEKETEKIKKQSIELFLSSVLATVTAYASNASSSLYKVEDLYNEICDMLMILDRNYVTLADLQGHKGALVPLMLIDAHAFHLYDNRESLLSTPAAGIHES